MRTVTHLTAFAAAVAGLSAASTVHAQCGGTASLSAAGVPDQALFGETCVIRGGEIFVGAVNNGTVHIYRRQTGGTPFSSIGAFIRPANIGVADAFGRGLAANNDVVAVGAPLWSGNRGTVTLYSRNAAGTWSTLQQIPSPASQPNLYFGSSIAMSGGYMVVGAPGALNAGNFMAGIVYLYQRGPDGLYALLATLTSSTPSAATDGQFGQCVGISGNTIIVGAPGEQYAADTRRGSLYVFQRATNGAWEMLDREKSATPTATTRAYAIDCAIDNGLVAVREQSSSPGVTDTIWLYSVGGSGLLLEPSYNSGATEQFSFNPIFDAALVGTISMRDGYMAVGCRETERADVYGRGATQWNFLTFYTGGGGDIDFGASVAVGHDIMAVGMPYWELAANNQPGAVWTQPHVTRDCDGDASSDACEAMSQPNSAFDDDFDGIPDNCDTAVAPAAAVGSLGTIADAVAVSWTVAAGANKYQLQRANGGGSPTTIATPYAPVFTDTSVSPDVLYTFTIKSIDGSGTVGTTSVQTTGWRPFAAPTGLTASDGTIATHVNLSWNPVAGAPGYKVFRSQGAGTPVQLVQTAINAYNDTSATPGIVYTYFVKTAGVLGDSAGGNSDTGFRSNVGNPSNCVATDGTSTGNVNITWTGVGGATGYKIYRGTTQANEAFLTDVSGGGTGSYNDGTATALTSYSYSVRAVVNAQVSGPSNSDTGWRNTAAPTGISATDGNSVSVIALTWNNVSGATGYIIWRSLAGGTLTQRATVGASPLAFADNTVTPGLSYTYAVQAVHALGTTALSNTDAGWRAFEPPESCNATDGNFTDRIRVTWSAVPDAQGYRVMRMLPGGAEDVLVILGPGSVTYDDSTVGPMLLTRYRVSVYSPEVGASAPSPSNFGYRNIAPPTNVAATDGTFLDHVTVTWNALAQATQYKIFRRIDNGVPVQVGVVPSGTLTFSDTTAEPLQAYRYSVKAVHSLGETGESSQDGGWINHAPPVASASDGTEWLGVKIEWTRLDNATFYEVYRGTNAQTLVKLATVPNTEFLDKSPTVGTLRYYAVRAVAPPGFTAQGPADSGWRGIEPPRSVNASDGTFKPHVAVSWKLVDGATGYMVARRLLNQHDDNPVMFGPFAGESFNDKTAVPGVRYSYAVAGQCALGACGYSTPDAGWRPEGPHGGGGLGLDTGDIGNAALHGGASGADGAGESAGSGSGSNGGSGDGSSSDGTTSGDGSDTGSTGDAESETTAEASWWHERTLSSAWLSPFDLSLPADTDLHIVLSAGTASTSSGAIISQGSVQLTGKLRVQLADPALAVPGAYWLIVSGANVTGQFLPVQLPAAPEGVRFELVQVRNGLWLRVSSSR